MIGTAVISPSRSAWACHSFNVAVNPSATQEGSAFNVTVSRHDGLASSIRVSTVDETAKAGQDYTPVNRTINFTPTNSSETFQVATNNDKVPESAETFKIHLSDPGGCPLNSGFDVGADVRLSIQDNDAAQPSPEATPGSGGASPSLSPSPGAPPVTGETPAPTGAAVPAPAPTDSPKVLAEPDDQPGGMSGASIVAIVGLVVSASAGGGLWLLRKTPA